MKCTIYSLSRSAILLMFLSIMLWAGFSLNTQAQVINWQKALGGGSNDQALAITSTADGGYVAVGSTASNDGDVTGNHGGLSDFWVVKVNSAGSIVWQKTLGGVYEDRATAVSVTPDDGVIVAGTTNSPELGVRYLDMWVMKLNKNGDIVWQKLVEKSKGLYPNDIKPAPGGGYYIAGSHFFSGFKPSGLYFYILKITETGDTVWDTYFGGEHGNDELYGLTTTSDGGCVVVGKSSSPSISAVTIDPQTDHNLNHNAYTSYDAFVCKFTSSGNMVWYRFFGGSGLDVANTVREVSDGGYVVAGYSQSNDYDVSGNHGGSDAWIFKLTKAGSLVWQKSVGGSGDDEVQNMNLAFNNDLLLAGSTTSSNGDVTGNHGATDAWLVRMDPTGNLIGQKTYGGSGVDKFNAIIVPAAQKMTLAGYSQSNNGDVSGNHGGDDAWIVQLSESSPNPTALQLLAPTYNCATGAITFNTSGGNGSFIDYLALGVTPWTPNPNQTVELGVRLDPNSSPLVLMARQSGQIVSRIFDFRAFCSMNGQAPVFSGPLPNQLGIVGQSFSFLLPAGSFTDPNNRAITFTATGLPPGLTINPGTGAISGIPTQLGNFITTITATNTIGTFATGQLSISISPAQNSEPLQLIDPLYTCSSGALVFRTTGGNGTPVEFLAIGVTPWTTNPNQTIDLGVRLDPNSQPLLLLARQSGIVVSKLFDFRGYCSRQARQSSETTQALQVQLLSNPSMDQTIKYQIIGAEGQNLRIRLINTQGKQVNEQALTQAQAIQRAAISAGNDAGLYLLVVETKTQSIVVKALVH